MQLKTNQIVWGKITGYPHWPCQILFCADGDSLYRVRFFGDSSEGEIPSNKICDFKAGFTKYAKPAKKQKKLKQAIEEAESVYELYVQEEKSNYSIQQQHMEEKDLFIQDERQKNKQQLQQNKRKQKNKEPEQDNNQQVTQSEACAKQQIDKQWNEQQDEIQKNSEQVAQALEQQSQIKIEQQNNNIDLTLNQEQQQNQQQDLLQENKIENLIIQQSITLQNQDIIIDINEKEQIGQTQSKSIMEDKQEQEKQEQKQEGQNQINQQIQNQVHNVVQENQNHKLAKMQKNLEKLNKIRFLFISNLMQAQSYQLTNTKILNFILFIMIQSSFPISLHKQDMALNIFLFYFVYISLQDLEKLSETANNNYSLVYKIAKSSKDEVLKNVDLFKQALVDIIDKDMSLPNIIVFEYKTFF